MAVRTSLRCCKLICSSFATLELQDELWLSGPVYSDFDVQKSLFRIYQGIHMCMNCVSVETHCLYDSIPEQSFHLFIEKRKYLKNVISTFIYEQKL